MKFRKKLRKNKLSKKNFKVRVKLLSQIGLLLGPHEHEKEIRPELKGEVAEGNVGEVFQRIDEAYEILTYISAGRTEMQEGLDKARALLDQATEALSKVSKKVEE